MGAQALLAPSAVDARVLRNESVAFFLAPANDKAEGGWVPIYAPAS